MILIAVVISIYSRASSCTTQIWWICVDQRIVIDGDCVQIAHGIRTDARRSLPLPPFVGTDRPTQHACSVDLLRRAGGLGLCQRTSPGQNAALGRYASGSLPTTSRKAGRNHEMGRLPYLPAHLLKAAQSERGRCQSGAGIDAPRKHLHDDEHLHEGSDVSQAGSAKPSGRCSSGPFKECRRKCCGGCSMRTNVSKAYHVFSANPLSCWVYWWT